MSPDDARRWISDARERSFPVLVTGLVLFHTVLGWPMIAVILLLILLMIPAQVWAARRAFPMPEHGDWTHG